MEESKYDALFKEYPELTKGNFGGFCIGEGWYNLINTLFGMITHYVTQHNEDVAYRKQQLADGKAESYPEDLLKEIKMPRIRQIKEKFGSLRFYIDSGDKRINHWIEFAEALSGRTCEECGAPGEMRNSTGWIHCLCDKHEEEYLERQRLDREKYGYDEDPEPIEFDLDDEEQG